MTGGQSLVSLRPSACCVTHKPWTLHTTILPIDTAGWIPSLWSVVTSYSEASLKHILAEFEHAEDVKRAEEE